MVAANQQEAARAQDYRLAELNERFSHMAVENEQKLEYIRRTMSEKIGELTEDNNRQLEQMRQTVDEKLQKTLEERLGQSFRLVSQRLEQVYRGLGEMQTLAAGVGDLKKVLSNVKTRGILGEIQLGAILEQILSPDQYDENVTTKSTAASVWSMPSSCREMMTGRYICLSTPSFPGTHTPAWWTHMMQETRRPSRRPADSWSGSSNPKRKIFTTNI